MGCDREQMLFPQDMFPLHFIPFSIVTPTVSHTLPMAAAKCYNKYQWHVTIWTKSFSYLFLPESSTINAVISIV